MGIINDFVLLTISPHLLWSSRPSLLGHGNIGGLKLGHLGIAIVVFRPQRLLDRLMVLIQMSFEFVLIVAFLHRTKLLGKAQITLKIDIGIFWVNFCEPDQISFRLDFVGCHIISTDCWFIGDSLIRVVCLPFDVELEKLLNPRGHILMLKVLITVEGNRAQAVSSDEALPVTGPVSMDWIVHCIGVDRINTILFELLQ